MRTFDRWIRTKAKAQLVLVGAGEGDAEDAPYQHVDGDEARGEQQHRAARPYGDACDPLRQDGRSIQHLCPD